MKTLNLTAFNADNVSKAIKAETFVSKIVNLGKNAQVLNQVLKAVKGKKSNATLDFFVMDGLQDALLNKALAIHNQDSAAKACKHDNYAQYLAMYKKLAKTMTELTADDKKKIKAIVATAQVLKDGILSQYAHDQIDFNSLSIAYGFDQIKANNPKPESESITGNDQDNDQDTDTAPAIDTDNTAAFVLADEIAKLDLDNALKIQALLEQHIASLQAAQAQKVANG